MPAAAVVLAARADLLRADPRARAVLPVSGLDWNDLGDPARVLETRARLALTPAPGELAAAGR